MQFMEAAFKKKSKVIIVIKASFCLTLLNMKSSFISEDLDYIFK